MDQATLTKLRALVKDSHSIVFLGGAGVSTASGIPDFRSPQGIYNCESKYGVPYETMLSHTYFEEHPSTFYEFYWSQMVNVKAKPNLAHFALADYEKRGHHLTIITQNIDGLHQEAGSKMVLEAHGSTKRYFCTECGERYSLSDITPSGVPHCPKCGGLIKPDVVLYEEPLDEEVLGAAVSAMERADLLIIGGTSMNVYPCAGLVNYFQGQHQIIINKEATHYDPYCEYVIHEDIGTVLSAILKE
jgi:NAD-dependent deacetylase